MQKLPKRGNGLRQSRADGMKLNTAMHLADLLSPSLPKAATREGFGVALVEAGEKDASVVALSSDVMG